MLHPSRSRLLAFAFSLIAFPGIAQDAMTWTPELSMQMKRVGSVTPSPQGEFVAYQVSTAVMDSSTSEWRTHIFLSRSDGSNPKQLTQGEHSATAPAWSPDGRWIAFRTARSGRSNIWRIRTDGGEAEQVTDVSGSMGAFAWSPDGSRIAFAMTDPETEDEKRRTETRDDAWVVDGDLKMVRLYLIDVAGASSEHQAGRLLVGGDRSIATAFAARAFDWSPDGESLIFSETASPKVNDFTKSDLAIVDVASGDIRALATTGAREFEPAFSPDGRWIAFRKSDDPVSWAFTSQVYLVSPDGATLRPLHHTFDRQASVIGWASDNSGVYVSENRGTFSQVSFLPADGGAPVDMSPDDMMVSSARLSRSGKHLGFTSQTPTTPPEAFVSGAGTFTPVQISRVQTLPDLSAGRTEVVRWVSDDGTEVEGLLTYPARYDAGHPVPMLVVIHGGPTGVFTRGFIGGPGAYPIAAFTSRGYAVLRANPRGSSGYGKDFRYANYGDWGGGDFRDIMSGVDAMVERGIADPDRLGVMGWSYGGFMTSWVITQTDRFRAASVGAGLPNLMSFSGTADVPDFVPDYFGGDFWETPEAWQAHSPLFNIKGVTTPTLIQHGERDARVPISQAYELRTALMRQGVETTMVVYPRQPHGIQEPKLQLDTMHRNLAWFDRWVMGHTP